MEEKTSSWFEGLTIVGSNYSFIVSWHGGRSTSLFVCGLWSVSTSCMYAFIYGSIPCTIFSISILLTMICPV